MKITHTLLLFVLSCVFSPYLKGMENKPVQVLLSQKIPTKDGISLDATIYKPRQMSKPLPVIVYMTPYIDDHATAHGFHMAENDFIFIAVNARGRGASEGQFVALENDANDGHDVVQWASEQSWSNGSIGMLGGSYLGYVQWATLKTFPKNLKSILPIASVGPGIDFPMHKNVAYPYSLSWLTFVEGKTTRTKLFGMQDKFWGAAQDTLYKSHLSLPDYAKLVGIDNSLYEKWLSNSSFNEYWKNLHPTKQDYNKINIPILSITGYYDSDYLGTMNYYKNHMRYGSQEAKSKHHLILGAWDHGQTRRPKEAIYGLKTGEASVVDMFGLYVDWFNWTLKGAEKPAFLEDRIAYYVISKNRWYYQNALTDFNQFKQKLFLTHQTNPDSIFQSGTLSKEKPKTQLKAHFESDPLKHYTDDTWSENYLLSQTKAVQLEGDGLIYHTEKFSENTVLMGEISASLAISMSVPDADLMIQVFKVQADGTSVKLTTDLVRMRFRDSIEYEKLLPIGNIAQVEFNAFNFTGMLLEKGSRLRILIHPINSPTYQKNFQSGGVINKESGKVAKKGKIFIHNNDMFSSSISIPLVSESEFDELN